MDERVSARSGSAKGSTFGLSAFGGSGWVARKHNHLDELGRLWADYRIDSEWRTLKAVLVHRPGDELLSAIADPEAALMLEPLDFGLVKAQHQAMADAYRAQGVEVHYVEPETTEFPNQMFCADQVAMTPQGAILARPAGQARAGEERWVARRLADLGVPILRTLTGEATFEGADLLWFDEKTAMVGRGHRTNNAAIEQITSTLADIGCEVLTADLPFGTMHLMGMVRVVDKNLAFCWPRRTPVAVVEALRERAFEVIFPPCEDDPESNRAMNLVTLGPRKVLMAEGLSEYHAFFAKFNVECIEVPTAEISKAAGNIGCLTSILSRETK